MFYNIVLVLPSKAVQEFHDEDATKAFVGSQANLRSGSASSTPAQGNFLNPGVKNTYLINKSGVTKQKLYLYRPKIGRNRAAYA